MNVKYSRAPFEINVDVMAELSRLETVDYESDYDFQADLFHLFTSLNDAHTRYYGCHHMAFSSYQPFILTAIEVDGTQTIRVKELTFPSGGNMFSEFWARDFGEFVGQKVLEIDGVEAVQYIRDFANKFVH
jgi:hypothetical protein